MAFRTTPNDPTLPKKDRKPFDAWMRRLDFISWQEVGMSIHDLPDMDFMASFEAGETAREFWSEHEREILEGY